MSLTGCNDDEFLKENPKYFYTPDNVFSTASQVDQVLVSCYSHIRAMYAVEKNSTANVFRAADGTDMGDQPKFRNGGRFNDYYNINPENGVFLTNFKHWYYLIAKANLAIYAADLEGIYWGSQEEKDYALAQARFFRAWAYRNLGELYGGVPIVTTLVEEPRFDFARTSRVETYQYAIDDLEGVLDLFPATPPQPGRIAKGAALHTLCQLYLDKGIALEAEGKTNEAKAAYDKAISYGDDVIDGGVHSLMTQRFGKRKNEGPVYYFANSPSAKTPETLYSAAGVIIEGNVFWDMFQTGNEDYADGNKESLWTAQSSIGAFLEDSSAGFMHGRQYGPVFRDGASNKYLNGSMEDVGGHGVCFTMPTFYARDIVYEGKWNKDMRNSEAVLRRTFLGNVPGTEYYGKVIPWDILYSRNGTADQRADDETRHYPVSCKIATDYYVGVEELGEANRNRLFRDEYIIRLAETILLRAEAKMRAGDNAGAASDINKLRERAQCEYKVTAADVNLDLILDERCRELLYEECRWNTLLRMGGKVAIERISKYAYWDTSSLNDRTFNLWPIPQNVIDSNKDVVIEQNPDW